MNLVGMLGKLLLSVALSKGGMGAGGLGPLLVGSTQGGAGELGGLLKRLAKGFNLSEQASNQIHAQLNAP